MNAAVRVAAVGELRRSFDILSAIFRTSSAAGIQTCTMDGGTVAIALPADAESARAALLHGRRVAREFGLSWFAVFIEQRRGRSQETVSVLAALVSAHGGSLRLARGDDVATAVVEISRNAQAHFLVIGHSHRPRLLRRFIRGTTERILEAKRPFAVIVAGGRMAI